MRLINVHLRLLVIVVSVLVSFFSHAAEMIENQVSSHPFAETPKRVVVLNWDLLEQVLALGVTPVGAPELASYRLWVVKPEAPKEITDIGSRSEPNLELIANLKPDVIFAALPQQDILPILEQIAPVVYLPNFTEKENAANTAITHFTTIGKLLDKKDIAEQQLAEMEVKLSKLKQKLAPYYAPNTNLVVMRFSTLSSVFLYSNNSSTQYVVSKLGFNNPIPVEPRAWGIQQTRINTLQQAGESYVLYMKPFPQEEKLQNARLWQALPFVKEGRVNSVRSVWNYGGAMSLLYLAEAITDSLIDLAEDK